MIEQRESLDPHLVADSFMNQDHRFPFSNGDGDGSVAFEKSLEFCNAGDVTGSPRSKGNSVISMATGVEKIEDYVVVGEDIEAIAVASGNPAPDMVDGQSIGHLEAGAQESYSGQKASYIEENSMAIMPAVPANGGEKKVGTLLAAAMRKYAVPRSSCYHGVTK